MFRFFEAILPIFYEDFLQKTFQIKKSFPSSLRKDFGLRKIHIYYPRTFNDMRSSKALITRFAMDFSASRNQARGS